MIKSTAIQSKIGRPSSRPESETCSDGLSSIERVILDFSASAFEDPGRYLLAIRTGATTRLSRALRDASGDAFDADDHNAQVNFVDADIAGGAELVRT